MTRATRILFSARALAGLLVLSACSAAPERVTPVTDQPNRGAVTSTSTAQPDQKEPPRHDATPVRTPRPVRLAAEAVAAEVNELFRVYDQRLGVSGPDPGAVYLEFGRELAELAEVVHLRDAPSHTVTFAHQQVPLWVAFSDDAGVTFCVEPDATSLVRARRGDCHPDRQLLALYAALAAGDLDALVYETDQTAAATAARDLAGLLRDAFADTALPSNANFTRAVAQALIELPFAQGRVWVQERAIEVTVGEGRACLVFDADPAVTLGSCPFPGGETVSVGGLLQPLRSRCAGGDLDACDELYWQAPPQSADEQFAGTCGGRREYSTDRCQATVASSGARPGEPAGR